MGFYDRKIHQITVLWLCKSQKVQLSLKLTFRNNLGVDKQYSTLLEPFADIKVKFSIGKIPSTSPRAIEMGLYGSIEYK